MPRRHTTEEFIEKARRTHGDKYDYTKTNYYDSRYDLIITCPKHGDFEQRASHHLSGCGCTQCSFEKQREARAASKLEFIEKSREKHGYKYNYEKVEYKNNATKVIITCPEHGDFKQKPNDHSFGKGCPKCYSYTGRTRLYLVELESHGETLIKIGITNHTTKQRYNNFENPDQTLIKDIAYTDFEDRRDAEVIEKHLLDKYSKYKQTPKIKFSGHTECLSRACLEELSKEFETHGYVNN